jgi:DNA-binding NarL/FixJ family response regulator
LKNTNIAELTKALETVAEGNKYFSKEINILDTNQDFRNTVTIEDKKVDEILSKREIEVLTLICKEYSNSEIAKKLFLSVSTVETHRKNLIAKLGVNNTVGLVKFALKNKLID